MEFSITTQAKLKAKKTRARKEHKFRTLRILMFLFTAVAAVSFAAGVFFVPYSNGMAIGISGVVFAVSLIMAVSFKALVSNFTSHWITTRLHERLWISGNDLCHFFQTAFAAGLNSRHADDTGYLFIIDINSIYDAVIDPESSRIEFKANGTGMHYSNVDNETVDREWALNGFRAVFYDYYDPSLIKALENAGVIFKRETLDFSIRDARI